MPHTKPNANINTNISAIEAVVSPDKLVEELPAGADAQRTVAEARRGIARVINGEDHRLLLVVGPCSIHDRDAALEYAKRLKELSERVSSSLLLVMRAYFEKPRTTLGWKGLISDPNLNNTYDINKGLRLARELLLEINGMGLPCATEWVDPLTPQYFSDLVAWAAIGARTVESPVNRELASGLSSPVGFKNSTTGDPRTAVEAQLTASARHVFIGIGADGRTATVHTNGNPNTHIVLRGGKGGTNYDEQSIQAAQALLRAYEQRTAIMVDCSHGNSNKDFRRQPIVFREVLRQRVAGNGNIVGIMLESNINEGRQDLVGSGEALKHGVSITDACVGWEETAELILDADRALARQNANGIKAAA